MDTNVIVLFGDGAAESFCTLVNRWSHMLPAGQWSSFQFILAGTEPPDVTGGLEENAAALVSDRNVVFYSLEEEPLNAAAYYDLVFDKVRTGTIQLHLVCDSGRQELSYAWLRALVHAAREVDTWTTHVLLYLMMERNSLPSERQEMISLLDEAQGSAFLLGDTNESGGRVTREERWNAAMLAILMNSENQLPIGWGAQSLGYSALNANGTELKKLRESAASRMLLEELEKPIASLAEADLELDLLPEGLGSLSNLQPWLRETVMRHTVQPDSTSLKNAWITTRIDSSLAPSEAVRRMRRFTDLNYTGEARVAPVAEELARTTEQAILERLRCSAATACLNERVFTDIADAFGQAASESVQPAACSWPKKPLGLKIGIGSGKEEYERQCRAEVQKSIQTYRIRKNQTVIAREMEQAFRRLAAWMRRLKGEEDMDTRRTTAEEVVRDVQRELDGPEAGNAEQLRRKYDDYTRELDRLHPKLSDMTAGFSGTFYQENGRVEEKAWRKLVEYAGRGLIKRLPGQFRGDFFSVLSSEFTTEEEREAFFEEYLRSGPRMFMNLSAQQSSGTYLLLVDERLTGRWFTQRTAQMRRVKTDNAENLTVYPLGTSTAQEYLQDVRSPYFRGGASGTGRGKSLFSGSFRPPQSDASGSRPRTSLFGSAAPAENSGELSPETAKIRKEEEKDPYDLRLEPDEKGDYRLSWNWRGNDQNAMVEIIQNGEKVGRVAVIPVRRFRDNGGNMNITSDVMSGKPVPAGILKVTVRDAEGVPFIQSAQVRGRRETVRYLLRGGRLEIRAENRGAEDKLTLRSTAPDGSFIYYPLYASGGEQPWMFQGLTLTDGKLAEDPAGSGSGIFMIRVENW